MGEEVDKVFFLKEYINNTISVKGGVMKKVIFVSLLLLSVFFIGSVAESAPSECQDYWCTYTAKCDDGSGFYGQEPATLCSDGFQGTIGSYWYGCDIFAVSPKNLLGDGGSMAGDIACSVHINARSIAIDLSTTEEGCTEQHRCVPCIGCYDSD